MIGQTLSHYRILDLLGEGGMGTVYLAEDTRLGRRVALKIPNAPPGANNLYHARFLREARSISALNHPRIATLYDYGETPDGRPFIVMELIRGRELGEVMRGGGMTLARAVEIIECVAEALAEAHRHGIIHRDIKPSNVFVNERGDVKVLDFGLAKLVEGTDAVATEAETLMRLKTRSDVMLGTPLYLSPEQARGLQVDARSDIFALGALLYECVAGRPPFSGATVMEIAAQVIHVEPPPPSALNANVPAELDRVTMKALAKRPEDRYQSAEAFAEELRELRAELAGAADSHAPRRAYRSAEHSHQSKLVTFSEGLSRPRLSIFTAGAVVVLALLSVWGVSLLMRPAPHRPPPDAEMLYDKGAEMLRDGAYWQASKTLQRAVELDPDYALAHARLAEAWMEQDYTDRADKELLTARQLVPDPSVLEDRDRLYFEAVTSTATRKLDEAIKAYEEIARRWPERAAVFVDLGRAYEKTDRVEDAERAIASYRRAAERTPEYATPYLRLGILYARRQEYPSAEQVFRRAEEIYKATGVTEGVAEVLYRRGQMKRAANQLPEAREQLERALDMAKTNGYTPKQIVILLQLSTVATNQGDAKRASDYAAEAVALAQADGLENLIALGLVDLGNTFITRDHATAEKYLQQGLAFAERNNARRVRAKAIGNLGLLRIAQGVTDEGVRLLGEARDFYRASGYRLEELVALRGLGRAKRDKGNYKEALEAFFQQLSIADQVGDLHFVALTHADIGNVYLRQENYPEALKRFDEYQRIERELKQMSHVGIALLLRADALWPLGLQQEAHAAIEESRAIYEKSGGENTEVLAGIHLTGAELDISERRFAEAKAKVARAFSVIDEKNKRRVAKAKLVLALAQVRSGASAESACREAVAASREFGDPGLHSAALLALAEALLQSGDAQGAASAALEAQTAVAALGQPESEWRAWLVAALASRRAKNEEAARQYAARAAEALSAITQMWGAQVFDTYTARADVQVWRRQLAELSAAPRPV